MDKFEYFSPIFGLVTEYNPTTENGGLFLAQYTSYKKTWQGLDIFVEKMENAKNINGLYKRSSHHIKRSVSHDEITGMMVCSSIWNTTHRYEIWKQLKSHLGAYPAVVEGVWDYLPYNPANYYSWGQLVGSNFSYLFLPFYMVNMMIALSKEKQNTSSKIIYDLELRTMPKTFVNILLKKYLDNKLKKMYGDNFRQELLKIYFHTEKQEFPLFQVVK